MRQLLFLTLLLLAGTLQAQWNLMFGWHGDFMIATIITFAFFAVPWEIIALSAFSAWWFTWRPDMTWEIVLVAILPLVWGLGGKHIPIRQSVLWGVAVIASITMFYLGSGAWQFLSTREFYFNLIVSFAFALGVFRILRWLYVDLGKGRMTLYGQILNEGRRNRV
jgi:hypothetical protein